MNRMGVQPWLKEKKNGDTELSVETVDMKRNLRKVPPEFLHNLEPRDLPLLMKVFFPPSCSTYSRHCGKAFGIKVSSPSAYLLDPSSEPTQVWAYRTLEGWPATTPQQGCWSREGTARLCLPRSLSGAQWRSRCQNRSGGYRDTASSKLCSVVQPGIRIKTLMLTEQSAQEGRSIKHKHR